MANLYLSDMKLLNQDHDSVNTALSAFEKDMFGGSANEKADQLANDAAPDSLSYLFSIFR